MLRTQFYCIIVKLCNRSSDKITHMAVKIAETREFEDNKKTRSLQQVTFGFVAKKLTALSDIFLTFGGYAPDCLQESCEW